MALISTTGADIFPQVIEDKAMVDRLQDLNDEVAMELLPVMLFIGLLMTIGVVGNSLVCYVFCFRLRMNTQNFLIVTLAVFDCLTSLLSMPMEIEALRYFYSYDSDSKCRLLRFFQVSINVASCFTVGLIGVDRYVRNFSVIHILTLS
jgi:hypothetical protein